MKAWWARLGAQRWFWRLVAGAALGAYLGEALYFAHHQRPVLDEGLYLYKGLLFVRGIYRPFQPYGPWTNHMPLSFLIPGYVQAWFGPGLRAGRYFAVLVGLLLWVGVWVLTRRFAGERWAAWAMVAAAAMPVWARVYSLAISEGLAAMLLVWSVVAALHPLQRRRDAALAGLISGLLVMTRINMAPVPIVLAFFFWRRHGWRRALWFVVPTAVVVGGLHALYWPDIVRLWAKWLPGKKFPGLVTWQWSIPGEPVWAGRHESLIARVDTAAGFWQTYALAWVSLTLATVVALRPFRRPKECLLGAAAVRLVVLLSWFLVLLHAAATLSGQNFPGRLLIYGAFFAPLALIALPLGLSLPDPPPFLRAATLAVAGLTAVAVGVGNAHTILRGVESGNAALQFIPLEAVGHWSHWFVRRLVGAPGWRHRLLLGAFLGGGAFGVGWLVRRRYPWQRSASAAAGLMLTLTLLSPFPWMSGYFREYDCGTADMLRQTEETAFALQKYIPEGVTLYWRAYSPVALLYLPLSVHTFPQQFNGMYSYRLGGDGDALERHGFWNQASARRWLAQSDVAVIEARYLPTKVTDKETWRTLFARAGFRRVGATPPTDPCHASTQLLIYRPLSARP